MRNISFPIHDVYDLWKDLDNEQARLLARLPQCECCGEPIQDEHIWEIDGKYYCEDCAKDEFRKENTFLEDE
jgi:formylmethanofuran dehydrogenase subunit E